MGGKGPGERKRASRTWGALGVGQLAVPFQEVSECMKGLFFAVCRFTRQPCPSGPHVFPGPGVALEALT